MPVIAYMAVADAEGEQAAGDNAPRRALDLLRDLVEPAVIAEEELESKHMEELIRSSLASINDSLLPEPGASGEGGVSLTMVIADNRRAYLGHVGSGRVYLLHDERLYDLTPTGELSTAPPPDETLHLFSMGEDEERSPTRSPAEKSGYLGVAHEVRAGYNEVEIVPGDIMVLCTDGLWDTVSEEEIVEGLLSAMNVQRFASQLVRLAFSRKPEQGATLTAWKYVLPGQIVPEAQVEEKHRVRRERAMDGLLISLLVLVLAAIFAVGFAFGWRLADAFRKPAKERQAKVQETEETASAEAVEENESSREPPQSAPVSAFPRGATVSGQGVRMRTSADVSSELVGLLRDGQEVTVLEEVIGADSMTWCRARGKVRSQGQDIDGEGYIRKDYLVYGPEPAPSSSPPASTPSSAPSSSGP